MWIELHDSLLNNRKVRRMARALQVSLAQVRGHLVTFWLNVLTQCADGNLVGWSCEDIADASEWIGDPDLFLDSMLNAGGSGSGFLEKTENGFEVHDWWEYAGNLKAAQRKKKQRQSKTDKILSRDCPVTVPRQSHECPANVPLDQTDQTDQTDRPCSEHSFNSFFNNSILEADQVVEELEGWLGQLPNTSPKPNEPTPMERLSRLEPLTGKEIESAVEKTKKAKRPGWNYLLRVLESGREKKEPDMLKGLPPMFKDEDRQTGPPLTDEMKDMIRQLGAKLGVHKKAN